MGSGADTTLWIRAFCDELARAGVREVVVAPGSRSTPLVLAFDADGLEAQLCGTNCRDVATWAAAKNRQVVLLCCHDCLR